MGRILNGLYYLGVGILAGALLLAVTLAFTPSMSSSKASTSSIVTIPEKSAPPMTIRPAPSPSPSPTGATKATVETITLSEKNTLTLRGVVTAISMSNLQNDLQKMSSRLEASDTIYLVLDTPGGSVDAGNTFIDMAKGLPQKVKTITLFAASMGFHIAQNLDERLIVPNGELMSHRMRTEGMAGEVPGALIVRTNHLLRLANLMDFQASERIGMPLADYQALIRDEYWVHGLDSIQANMADRIVRARCDSSLMGTEDISVPTLFGNVAVTLSKCPVIRGPLKLEMAGLSFPTQKDRLETKKFLNELYFKVDEFVQDYIETGRYQEFVF